MGWKHRIGLLFFALAIAGVPWVFRDSYFHLIHIGIYAIICIGLSLLLGYAGQISLGHAAFYAIGAYVSGVLTARYGWSPWLAVWAGVALSAVIALAVGLPCLRLHGHYLAMATLAFGEIVHVVLKAWSKVTGGSIGLDRIPKWSLLGYKLTVPRRDLQVYYFVWCFVLLGLVAALCLIHSRVGRALRSIHDSEQAANVLGVPTAAYKVKVFVLSAIYASVAGSVYAHIRGFISPTPFGIEESILFVIMVIVGGMRSVWGAVFGALVMGLLPELLSDLEKWRFLLYGVVLLLIMIFVPQGVFLGTRDLGLWTGRRARRLWNRAAARRKPSEVDAAPGGGLL